MTAVTQALAKTMSISVPTITAERQSVDSHEVGCSAGRGRLGAPALNGYVRSGRKPDGHLFRT